MSEGIIHGESPQEVIFRFIIIILLLTFCYRNLQKKEKKARYEMEKAYMESIRGMGNVVGDYVGDGQGDSEHATQAIVSADLNSVDADGGVVEDQSLDDEEDISNNAEPLLFVYDCETTGLSVYDDHITDIAAMVIASIATKCHECSVAATQFCPINLPLTEVPLFYCCHGITGVLIRWAWRSLDSSITYSTEV